jgi:hypothetical protein
MSSDESEIQHTQHAFLVAWGWFGEHIRCPGDCMGKRLLID